MRRAFFSKSVLTFILSIFAMFRLFSQTDSSTNNVYEGFSLADLLEVKIVSASKSSELLFEAPLSASVVTAEEIRNSGATSIMEALRLVPGMIIREQTNGNYDIYLRGMDNVPPNSLFEGNSTTTLVMINNRPIYNYLKGGTFWETLPIDLNDVEKIEVVRGPAAALYGPNAVSGVINIITLENAEEGLLTAFTSRQGSNHTFINNASLGYRFNKKLNVTLSGNYQLRNRSQQSYYEAYRNEWLTNPPYMLNFLSDTVRDFSSVFPSPQSAMEKYAANVYVDFDPSDNINIDASAGTQHSIVQKVSTENGFTPLTTVASDSRYAELRAKIYDLSAQLALNRGTQIVDHQPGNKYDFHTADAIIEYNFSINRFSLKPGLGYRHAIYDDTKYSDTANKSGIFNSRGLLTTNLYSLRSEYKFFNNKVRLIAGVAANKFNYPDTTYLSYEFAATWKPSKSHLFRAVVSQAPRSANIYDNYVNQNAGIFQTGAHHYVSLDIESNKQLKLLKATMFELGFRSLLSRQFSIDLELFDIEARNYSGQVAAASHTKLQGVDTFYVIPLKTINLPVTFSQQGITLSANYQSNNIQAKTFVTVQTSKIRNYSIYANTPDADPSAANPNTAEDNIYSGMGTSTKIKSTPTAFGGAYFNYQPNNKWTLNLSSYVYSTQTYYHVSNTIFRDGTRGIDHLKAKTILNAHLSYEVIKGILISCSAKNMLNNRSREFFYTDEVPFMLLGGINFQF